MNKKKFFSFWSALLCVLLCIAAALVIFVLSPLHPKNIADSIVAEKGTEYTVRLVGISDYDSEGFSVVADGFYSSKKKIFVNKDEEGYARTFYDGKGETYILGEYDFTDVHYENYVFCGESYKNVDELEDFFELPDRIYNFDINKLPDYIHNVINFEKKFNGKATVRIYRGRCVITEVYIDGEKVLELRK